MNAPMPWTRLATAGAFTTEQAARLTGTSARAVAAWLRGEPPLIVSDYAPVEGRRLLSFEGVIEARAVAYLLAEGFKTRRLRALMVRLRERSGQDHPLAWKTAPTTTGDRVFEESEGRLINLLNDCYADPDLMRPALRGRVVFDGARALYLEPEPNVLPLVRIDPQRAFGRPVVVDGAVAVPTTALAEMADEESPSAAAAWFGVSEEAVRQAVAFEHTLAA
jgi:uncharacterized protein (DUF433 family)